MMVYWINLLKEKLSRFKSYFDMYFAQWYPTLPDVTADLRGKRAIVTGANSGVGFVIAKRLAELGAEVWLICRTEERARKAADEIRKATGNERVFVDAVDFSSLSQVRGLVDRWAARSESERLVDILINNAGVVISVKSITAEGFETTYVVNMLSQFLMTIVFLKRGWFASDARIVQVSSIGQYGNGCTVDPEDLNSSDMLGRLKEGQSYEGKWLVPYGRSKAQQTVFTRMLQEKLLKSERYKDVIVSACHPGCIWTPIWRQESSVSGMPGDVIKEFEFFQTIAISADEGAKVPLYLALAPEPAQRHLRGRYWDRYATRWCPAWMEDEALRRRLWERWQEDANIEADAF